MRISPLKRFWINYSNNGSRSDIGYQDIGSKRNEKDYIWFQTHKCGKNERKREGERERNRPPQGEVNVHHHHHHHHRPPIESVPHLTYRMPKNILLLLERMISNWGLTRIQFDWCFLLLLLLFLIYVYRRKTIEPLLLLIYVYRRKNNLAQKLIHIRQILK